MTSSKNLNLSKGDNKRYVNWCSFSGDPTDVFVDHAFTFDETKVNWPMLLAMSGCYSTYLDAVRSGLRGWIDYGWYEVEENGIVVTVWNPDPHWSGEVSSGEEVDKQLTLC